jgi:NADPH:quinone reductase-like Zn-dependent oxidoreductase
MRAVQVTRFGGPEVLRMSELERPSPISTEVLVRVIAAGVNPVDCKTRRGEGVARWVGPPPFVPGWDVAGVVEAAGYGVTRFRAGDRVYGMPRFPRAAGAYSEYVTAPSRQFARAPESIGAGEAAALPLAALTVWQSLVETARLVAGQTVLVHGASGGVGHLAVQIAKARGAHVVATARREHHALLRELGADDVLDREARSTRHADAALDLAGGAETAALLDAVREGGVLLAVAEGASAELKAEAARRGIRVEEPLVEPDGHALEEITELVDSARLRVIVAESFPLDEVAVAHARLERGGVLGKLVLEVARDD